MKKNLIIIISIVLVLLLGVVTLFFFKSSAASINDLSLNKVTVDKQIVTISGDFQSSALVYKGNSYKIQGDSLYVEVKRGMSNIFNRNGTFSFSMNVDTTDITKVYFVGQGDKKLIWNK